MGELFSPIHLIILLFFFFPLIIVPYWRILTRVGFPPALSVLTVVPILNLLLLYYIAFAEWKTDKG